MERRLLVFLSILSFAGCGNNPSLIEKANRTQAQKKLITIANEELKVDIVTKIVDNTLWIYIPLKESLIEIKASGSEPSTSKESSVKPTINYLDSQYKDKNFIVDYNISLLESYPKDYGYGNSYSERYQLLQQGLLSAVYRSFYNVDPMFEESHQPVEFVTFVIADIKNGLEAENIVNLLDVKMALSPSQILPQDEFIKRYISEFRGSKNIIDDKEGDHLDMQPIPIPEFLARQIKTRINFKFTQSAFPPSEEAQKEILAQVRETFRAYKFTSYEKVILNDLRSGNQVEFSAGEF